MMGTCIRHLTGLCVSFRAVPVPMRMIHNKKGTKPINAMHRMNKENLQLFGKLSETVRPKKLTKKKATAAGKDDLPKQPKVASPTVFDIMPYSSTCVINSYESSSEECYNDDVLHSQQDHSPSERVSPENHSRTSTKGLHHFPMMNGQEQFIDSSDDDILRLSSTNTFQSLGHHVKNYPTVTAVLSATMPEKQAQALERWKQNLIAKLGEAGFAEYQQALFKKGHSLHHCIASHLGGESDIIVPKDLTNHWNTVLPILHQIKKVKALESHVLHPILQYRGVVDCVGVYGDSIVAIEWKITEKLRTLNTTYDAPIQTVAYLGALNFDPEYKFQVKGALVVPVCGIGICAPAYYLNQEQCQKYWHIWLERLALYRQKMNSGSQLC